MSGRVASVVGGVLATALGCVLVFRPFASLAVLVILVGVGLLALAVATVREAPADRRSSRLRSLVYGVSGLVVLFWPGLGTAALAVGVGVLLLAAGATRAAAGLRATRDERLAAVLAGAADVVLGVVALAWPDVTLVVVAVVFGVKLVWAGLTAVGRGVAGPRPVQADAAPTPRARVGHLVASAGAFLVAAALTVLSATLDAGTPVPDAFYDSPDEDGAEPGRLLRVDSFDRGLPAGAVAWRILYTTTRDEGVPAVASALVVTSAGGGAAPRPVVAWAHGTTGVAEGCAPTLLDDPVGSGGAPGVRRVLASGWTVVATDYVGLGTAGPHPYLIGQGQARSLLDGVRAARQMREVEVSEEAVVWGHSQGGHAALWTGQLATSYAPDVDLRGVAAIAPASNLVRLVGNLDVVKGGPVFASYVLDAYSEVYDDVSFNEYVRFTTRTAVREMSQRCLAEPAVFVSIVESLLFDRSVFARSPTSGPLGERLRENTPLDPIPVPLLVAQGASDPLVLPDAQAAYVQRRCELGDEVEYRTYPGRDHAGVVGADSPLVPDLLEWTQARFDATPAEPTCR